MAEHASDLSRDEDVWTLTETLKRAFRRRNEEWSNRRTVRYRRMGEQLKTLPLNPMISDQALMVQQTEIPNQEVHKRVKRLVANPPRFEVVVMDDDAGVQRLGQELEDGTRALYKWMNRGKVPFDWKVTQFQQGDGLGIGAVDFLPGHGSSLTPYDPDKLAEADGKPDEERSEEQRTYQTELEEVKKSSSANPEAKAYQNVTEKALRSERPPFRLRAVDPLACYWWEDGDQIAVIAETGKKSLNPLLKSFESSGLRYDSQNNRLEVTKDGSDAIGSTTTPDISGVPRPLYDLDTEVNYTEVRTRDQIIIAIENPTIRKKGRTIRQQTEKGVILRFDNPFGPYTTGYVLIPGDVTTETDPCDEYQPPILGVLNTAQALNVLATARLSSALETALSPKYIKVDPDKASLPATDEDKTPEVKEGRELPVIPGEIKRIDPGNVDLDKADARLIAETEEGKFQDVLVGDAQSQATGHRLALQVAQADIQMVPYQNARADAITELMKGIIYAIKKHGLPVYIPTIPDGKRKESTVRVAKPARITPEMADIAFELIVTLGSETPVTKFAKWRALQEREQAGTLGYQTLIEESDTDNPEQEITRVVEGKVLKATIEQIVPLTVELVMATVKQRIDAVVNARMTPQPTAAPGVGPGETPPALEEGPPGPSGFAAGGGPNNGMEGQLLLPGVGMPIMPSLPQYETGVPGVPNI